MSIAAKITSLAEQYAGVNVSSSRGQYVDLLGPTESPAMQQYFCDPSTSGCALVIRGLWRKLGVIDRRVFPPYVFGKAISWLVGIARDRGAWYPSKLSSLPNPGDFVLVGGDKVKDGGVEHVFTVLTVTTDGTGALITSIDGGQRDQYGNQAIQKKVRRWIVRGNSYWDVSSQGTDPGSNALGGRRVIGWGDGERIVGFGLTP